MEAARVAAIRGHEVILYEKEPKLGGLLPWVAVIKGNDVDRDANTLVKYLKAQIIKLGVKIRLGKEFSPSLIGKVKPDVVILAAGGISVVPEIPGIKGSNVLSIDELYSRLKDHEGAEGATHKISNKILDAFLGDKIVIIGGTTEGFTLAGFLVEYGRDVTIVDTGKVLNTDRPIPDEFLFMLMGYRSAKKPTIIKEVKYEEITGKGLTITTKDGKRQTIEADTIIHALTPRPNTELLKDFEGKAPEVYLVFGGDGKGLDSIMDAIGNGYRIARAV
jgi:2,4-dienoyl-CoA reductase (NADPH2)